MSFTKQALLALKRIAIVFGIFVAFTLGLLGAIYLSLRSSQTRVPDIVGKDRAAAESTISSAGLNFRVRAMRPGGQAKPDTVLIQLPPAGEIVKVGQTVAVDLSRPTKEGESSNTSNTNTNTESANTQENNKSTSANSNTNVNDNKSKRKPANKNANENLNSNSNRPNNQNPNANRPRTLNGNASPAGTPAASNQNANPAPRGNANRGNANSNNNRRAPVTAPTP